jgi:hypothetical protein
LCIAPEAYGAISQEAAILIVITMKINS